MSDLVTERRSPKYSIIIPTKDGMPYLEYCLRSVLSNDRQDIEVIVSVDDETLETKECLSKLADSRVRILKPKPGLSMSEHWDFAQLHAVGRWQIFLGQDDMLVSGYEQIFDALTAAANLSGLEVVVSRRAYITWPPIQAPNLKPLQYWSTEELKVINSEWFVETALLSEISYHEGPQMYTTTVVSAPLIKTIRKENKGRLILGHPQDAFLAAVLLKYSPNYFWSGQPFGWVGTSSQSAGLAITRGDRGDSRSELASSYSNSVNKSSSLPYKSSVDFRHGVNSRYFYDALVEVWPEIVFQIRKQKPLFGLRLDANILACFDGKVSSTADKSELVTSLSKINLKRALSLCLRLIRFARRTSIEVVSAVAGSVLAKKYNYVSIKQARGLDELYLAAANVVQGTTE